MPLTDSSQSKIDADLARLRSNGLVLPRHPQRAQQAYAEQVMTTAASSPATRQRVASDVANMRGGVKLGRTISDGDYVNRNAIASNNQALISNMGQRRGQGLGQRESRTSRMERLYPNMPKTAVVNGGGSPLGGDVYNGIPRFYDPLEYWDLSGLPWNVADEGHRHKLHKWLRLYYATHYLVPILVDIFTRFPLVGMELSCKDSALTDVYDDIFLQQLNYPDFLVSLGREFWCVGEAFPLGSFDEDLGIWEHEELINPEDVVIDNFPLLDTQQIKIVPPDYLRRIAQTKSPAREWYMLQENYADLIPYLLKGEHIPISPVMIRQVANKMNDWDDHGTPILLRGLRTLIHEEKLLASQDAIAERLYSPFILAKLGIMDMGDGLPPWVPGPDELNSVRDDIDIAMASDFRVMVHHFGLDMESVFGREQMPRLGDDFDRVERRLMQVFGINPSLLSAGSNSQPYASSALQAEFMNQILRTYQQVLKTHYRERALVVAEAQGHYDYERKGKTRVPIYETVVVYDEDGNKNLERRRKLLVPDLEFSTFDLRDEATERQFMMELRGQGVPIPDEKLMVGVRWKQDDFITTYNTDVMEKTISQQQAKMDTYIALVIKGLPVPMDLKYEVESVLAGGTGPTGGPPGGGGMGGPPPGGMAGGVPPPGGGGMMMPDAPPGLLGPGPGSAPPGGGTPPISPESGGPPGNVPDVSNERRPGLSYNTHTASADWEGISYPRFAGVLASKDEIEDLADVWPLPWRKRAVEIREELEQYGGFTYQEPLSVVSKLAASSAIDATVIEDSSETEDPNTWNLSGTQSKDTDTEGNDIIMHQGKKRIDMPIEASRSRYSIIDPMVEETNESE
jgi:hypothetical protein